MPSPDMMENLQKIATETPERARLVNGILMGGLVTLGTAFAGLAAWAGNRIYSNLLTATGQLKDEVNQLRQEAEADRARARDTERELLLLKERAVVRNDCHAAHEAVVSKLEEIRREMETNQQRRDAEVFARLNGHIEDHLKGAV